jgi:hypothetical protein
MLEKAKAYKSPSPDHDGLAEFMRSQLLESICYDCNTSYYEERIERIPYDLWRAERQAALERDIAYHRKHHAKEIERTQSRNEWVRKLKESLESQP